MRLVTAAAFAAAFGIAAAPAFGHGGQYRGPGAKSPPDPTPTAGGPAPTSTTDWEAWWAANAWKYVNLRERLRLRDNGGQAASGGGLGAHGEVQQDPVPAEEADPRTYFEKEALPVVTDALEDEDAEVRSAAAVALGKMGYARSLLALRKALKDPVRDVRDGAILAMGLIREPFAADELRAVLLDPREQDRTRSFAAIGLGLLGGEDGTGPLVEFLDPAADAKREGGIHRTALLEASALTGLGMSRRPAVAPQMRKDYDSATRYEPAVRAFAAVALARLGDRAAIPSLLQGLEFPKEPMRQSSALALGMLGTPEDGPVVAALSRKLYDEKDVNTRQFCLMSLARIGGDEARAAVRRYLDKGSRIDLPLAGLACAIGKDKEALPVVRKLYQDEKQPSVKAAYVLALGLYGDRDSAPEIRKLALAQGDRGLRCACMTALGLMDDKDSAGPVRKLLDEENDPAVKIAAATCLGLLQDRAVVGVLERLVKEGDNVYVRAGACRLLGYVGAPPSTKVLAAIVKDRKDNSVVRMSATAALGNLADQSLIPILSQFAIDGNYASSVDPLIEIATIM
jgi:HEAT repeat protein